jgi:Putative DNA-binding domain
MAGLIFDSQRLSSESTTLAALVAVPDGCDAVGRLRVYANGYPARLEEALRETFPAVEHVIGAGAFAALVRRFADTVPLHSYSLSDAGEQLPDFLRSDPLTSSLPFLPDLARLEWHVARAFHATDDAAFDPSSVAHWSLEDWERAVLRFQPWVALVESDWPVREIWECSETPIEQIDIDLRDRTDHVLVRREGFAVICESLGTAEAHALRLLLNGESLGTAVAALADRGEEAASVSTWLARWVTLRMIAGCTCRPSGVDSASLG